MPLKKRTPVLLIHIDAVSKRLYMTLKKRPFLKKLVCVFLKAYMAVLKRRLYGLVKQMSVSLEAYINGCLETINIWYCKTLIIFVFVFFWYRGVLLQSYMGVWKRFLYGLIKRFCVFLEAYMGVSKRLYMGVSTHTYDDVLTHLHTCVLQRRPLIVAERQHIAHGKPGHCTDGCCFGKQSARHCKFV